jgi:tRNA (guanine-N7-)-methyltransferase
MPDDAPDVPQTEHPPLRSYGRRKGHRLSPYKSRLMAERLPVLRLDLARPAPQPLTALFPATVGEVWLEIGFGAGEHLIWQAERHPQTGLIGCEPFLNGVASLLSRADQGDLANFRLHDGDARAVLAWLPAGSISRVFLLFPDPWPKMRHRKRRLLEPETAVQLARVLRPGGEFRFASDFGDYLAQALLVLQRSGAFEWLAEGAQAWRQRGEDWPETRYERKALNDGRKCAYLRFRRV